MNWKLFFITLSRIFIVKSVAAGATTAIKETSERFALRLSSAVGAEHPKQNVIISPLLIQTALTLLYYGSTDETANVLRSALDLQGFPNKEAAVANMASLLSTTKSQALREFHCASSIYVEDRFTFDFKDDFKQVAQQQFHTATERLDFGKNSNAFDKINYSFLTQLNFTIGELFSYNQLFADLEFILASAATFKAPWATAFDTKETEKLNFHSDQVNYKPVPSMFIKQKFMYAELDQLNAKAIELPFDNANLKMLLIYPNEINGLQTLEEQMKHHDLSTLTRQLSLRKVALTFPKFHAEFNIDLKSALSNLGLAQIFSSSARFKKMFSSLHSVLTPFVTRVQHKAVLEIDESGETVKTSGFSFGNPFTRKVQMVISHPFYFAIKSDDAILLTGHIVDL